MPDVSDTPPPSDFSSADPDVLRESTTTRAEVAFLMLAGVFIGALVMTNAIAGKFFVLFGQELSAGIIAYPVTFLVTDLISELYGRKRASTVVGVGFVVSVFVTLVVWIAAQAPVYDASPVSQEAFDMVFGLMPGIVLGSMIAYLTAQYIDVQIYEGLRTLTSGRYMWIRNNGSTFFSQLVDTTMVVTIALVWWPQIDGNPQTEALAWSTWQGIVFGQYVFKLGIAALDTPVLYACVHALRRWIANDPHATTYPAASPEHTTEQPAVHT